MVLLSLKLNDKANLLSLMINYHCIIKPKAAIDQFVEALVSCIMCNKYNREFYVFQVLALLNIILHMYVYYKTDERWMVGSSLTGSIQDRSSTDVLLLL